jgi:DNA-binding response OmpR family regulator
MIVDEHWPDVPEYARIAKEFPGSKISCYTDYKRAFGDCASNTPTMLLVDGDAWKTDSAALIRRLRVRIGWKKLAIVLIGSKRGTMVEDARVNGADAFIKKPIQAESLMRFLHNVLDLRRARSASIASAILGR